MKTRRRNWRRGSTLIFTLWLMVALASAALYFGQASAAHYRRGANAADALGRQHAADAAERYVVALLSATEWTGSLPDESTYTAEDLRVGDYSVFLLKPPLAAAADELAYGLDDAAARLNLNAATVEMLEELPGMTTELAAAIVDWRDTDDELTVYGAETPTYLGADPPYTAKNGPFETVDELRLVHGADRALLLGRDLNRNGVLEQWETDLAAADPSRFDTAPDQGLLELLTVQSRESNVRTDGTARADLNGPPQQVRAALQQAIGSRADAAMTAAGVGQRPFTSVMEFAIRAALNSSDAAAVWPYLRVGNAAESTGLVNINTASETVLAAIPSVDETSARMLVNYRLERPTELTSPFWFFEAMGENNALAAGPHITTTTSQVVADIVVVSPGARGFSRQRLVIDMTSGSPVIVERRDLTHLGWPLGEDRLTELRDRSERTN